MSTTMTKGLHKSSVFGRVAACRKGSAALQMAIALSVLLVFIFGTFELGMIMFVSSLAEGGLREAARYGITGQAPTGSDRATQIAQIVSEHTHGLVNISPTSLTTKVYPSFADIGAPEDFQDGSNGHPANGQYDVGETFTDVNGNSQWDSDMGAPGEGGPGQIVLYELNFDWELMTPVLTVLAGQNDTMALTASIAVRNEPFPTAAPQP